LSSILFLAAIFLTSIAAGGAGAILGLGGGILLVPILTMLFGIGMHYAMGASIVSVVATSSGAAAAYLGAGIVNLRIGLFLATATTFGALAGAFLSDIVPIRALQIILGITLAHSSLDMFRRIQDELPAQAPPSGIADRFGLSGSYFDPALQQNIAYRAGHVARGYATMFASGILSGLLGIGSGAFNVLALDRFMRLPMKVSTATSNFMMGITAAASTSVYFGRGDVHPLLAAPVAAGVLLGANLGTRLMPKLRTTTIRKAFLPVLLYLAFSMLYRGFGIGQW
jgi:uncharacterized membrane protein YfcA